MFSAVSRKKDDASFLEACKLLLLDGKLVSHASTVLDAHTRAHTHTCICTYIIQDALQILVEGKKKKGVTDNLSKSKLDLLIFSD